MEFGPVQITVERLAPDKRPRSTPPYEFGVWHLPVLPVDSYLRIHFTSRTPQPFSESFIEKESATDLGVIINTEKSRIWTRAEMGSKAFARMRYVSGLELSLKKRGISCYSTLYVNNEHVGRTFRYTPEQLSQLRGIDSRSTVDSCPSRSS